MFDPSEYEDDYPVFPLRDPIQNDPLTQYEPPKIDVPIVKLPDYEQRRCQLPEPDPYWERKREEWRQDDDYGLMFIAP